MTQIATQPTFVDGRLVKPGRTIPAPVEPDDEKPRAKRPARKADEAEKLDGGE